MYGKPALRIICLTFVFSFAKAQPGKQPAGPEPWKKGYLDIHHINTGRGNAAFAILPDGTTLLIDAGELSPLDTRTLTPRNAGIKPNNSQKPFEWIARYIHQVIPAPQLPVIDYALITHFHDDHFGAWYPGAPVSASGNFVLTGITGLGELLVIKNLVDRGYPSYDYPYPMQSKADQYGGGEIEFGKTMDNYLRFTEEKKNKGMKICSLKAGSRTQLSLTKDPSSFPDFFIRNVKCNQWIWTGTDSSVHQYFPVLDTGDRRTWPDENSLSMALTIHYGNFTYYTGGDNPGVLFPGDPAWRDVGTPVARAVGRVDVATMDHHGNRDAINENMVKILRPGVWIGQTWSADHPGHEVLVRITSRHLYAEPRDLFCTNMLEANKLVIGPLIDRSYKSLEGHILVRVYPGGTHYDIIILDDTLSSIPVKAVFGPYYSTPKK